MFGRGVIATQCGWALEKAGNTVEFYVRQGRVQEYGSFIHLGILDGRHNSKGTSIKEIWPHVLRDNLTVDHDYDLIIVSVKHDAFSEAISFLSTRVGRATVLIFNNFWEDPATAVRPLPSNQVVWGFPGGGGQITRNGILRGGAMKTVNFGTLNFKPTSRDNAVRDMFKTSAFKISESKDFRAWLWFHFLLDAALRAQALKAGSIYAVMDSSVEISKMVQTVRDFLPRPAARGIKPPRSSVPSLLASEIRRLDCL